VAILCGPAPIPRLRAKEIVEDQRYYFGGCSIAFSGSGMVRAIDLWRDYAD
jgi:hypothetical protein